MGTTTEEKGGTYGLKAPEYKPPPKCASEKGPNEMYPFTKLNFGVRDIKNRFNAITGPLTLYAPFSHEDEPEAEVLELDRPVTPINEEVKSAPPHFEKLAKFIRRRIEPRNDIEHLDKDDQQALAAVIMGEVNSIWPDLRQQVNDPFMSDEENHELHRRITVHIITVCEKLFSHYLQKAQLLNKRGVFSGPANMSRLKAQLALEANKFLNVLTIRRYIVGDMRHRETDSINLQDGFMAPPPQAPQAQPTAGLSYKGLVAASRPKSRTQKQRYTTAEENLKEIRRNMPVLDTSKLVNLLNDLPDKRAGSELSGRSSTVEKKMDDKITPVRKRPEDFSREKCVLKRCPSVPELGRTENIMDELGIDEEDGRRSALSMTGQKHDRSTSATLSPRKTPVQKPVTIAPEPGTRAYAADDLQRLLDLKDGKDSVPGEEEDLPPLLQALTRSAKHDGKKEVLQQQLKELEEKELERNDMEKIHLKEPTHPQPATVASKLPNKMVVRTSDIRVSERVCLSSITLEKNATVYNDLIDEIDAETVKKIDSSLFLGDEITEVYREIMRTVPADHLSLENDPHTEPAADHINLNAAMASSTLSRRPRDRVINPRLQHEIEPPWRDMIQKEWAKTPHEPIKDLKGKTLVDSMREKKKASDVGKTADQKSTTEGEETVPYGRMDPTGVVPADDDPSGMRDNDGASIPSHMQDFMARSYASWLMWWKNTMNSDDYMKYLSTQETDFLGVVFHFYNSDDEDDDEDEDRNGRQNKMAAKLAQQQELLEESYKEEREAKVKELRAQKTEYKDGLWNVNAVLLGGLGKDPPLEEDVISARTRTPTSVDQLTEVKSQHYKTKVLTRKQKFANQVPAEQAEVEHTIRGQSRLTGLQSHSLLDTRASRTSLANLGTMKTKGSKVKDAEPEDMTESPQDRLEKVWTALHMPDSFKLDMAIKYSSDDFHDKLSQAIEQWELATDMILKREAQVARLEGFERLASDPNRFFEKGHRGSSVARLGEAKTRANLYRKIDTLDAALKKVLDEVKNQFDDVITFQGRPYIDKMKWDRVEMLYWLQEERKAHALELESRMKQMPLGMVQLDPIATH